MSRRKKRRDTQNSRASDTNLPAERPQQAPPTPKQEELFGAEEVVEFFSASFTGPLPLPSLLREYENVLPGLGDRIVRMAEAEGSSRRHLASRRLRIAEWGLLSAFLIALIIVGCATYAAVHGAEMVGLAGVLSTVAALVTVFITGKRNPPPNGASEGEEEPKKRTGG